MKKILLYSAFLVLLSSCSTVNSFSKRKYMPGFNFDPVSSFSQPVCMSTREGITSYRNETDSTKKKTMRTVRDTTTKTVRQENHEPVDTIQSKNLPNIKKPNDSVPSRNDGWKSPTPVRTVSQVPDEVSDNPFPLIKAPKPLAVLVGLTGTGLAAYSFTMLLAFNVYGFILGLAAVILCGLFYGYTDIRKAPLLTVLCYITMGFGLLELILLAIVGAGWGGK